jgi:hypothetical protein
MRSGPAWKVCTALGVMLCAVALDTPPLEAQRLHGRVVDAGSGAPVADATISALDAEGRSGVQAVSDSAGGFTMPIMPGRFTLHVIHIGYEDLTTEPIEFSRGEVVTLEIRVGASPIRIEPLIVQSRRRIPIGSELFYSRMERQRKLGEGDFITRAEIEQSSVGSVNDLLARHPQLSIMSDGLNEFIMTEQRGGRRCRPALWVDGIRLLRDTDLSAWFMPGSVEGIEIYPNASFVPPELAGGESCGAIAIWSRAERGNPFTIKRIAAATAITLVGILITR